MVHTNLRASDGAINPEMVTPIEYFRLAIEAAGLTPPPEIIDDGSIHRFSADGKQTKKNGWYVLHGNGLAAGAFGDWRSGLTIKWCGKAVKFMTASERQAHRERIEAVHLLRQKEQASRQKLAAAKALKRWTMAQQCDRHEYLTRKGIQPHGVRVEGDRLLIPLRDTSGTIHSLQTITPDGSKLVMLDGRVKACYFGIGKPQGVLIVCEGFATGASIHECTGHAVAVAFNAGNLEAVAVALHIKYPDLKIIIAADNDHKTIGNPGMTKATAAANAAGGCLAVPIFLEPRV